MEIYGVVKKLIGPIEPVGSSQVDEKRYENLEAHIDLLYALLTDLQDVSKEADRVEHSMKKAGAKAARFFETLPDEFYIPCGGSE